MISSPTSLAEAIRQSATFSPEAIPVETTLEVIRRLVRPVSGTDRVPLSKALGRVLAADLISPIDVPAHDNAAMDGYSMRAASLASAGPSRLLVAGAALAGRPFQGEVPLDAAIRIMTGAVMPSGHDMVVVQEIVQRHGDWIEVPPGQASGQHRRLRGEDLQSGGVALPKGRRLNPADLGLAASLGLSELEVTRRVRVALMSTGDELRAAGQSLGPGEIYDSNRHTLSGLLSQLGVEVIDLGIVPDRPEALESAMTRGAREADAIISSAGVSVGEADFTRAVMDKLGEVAFWKIAMRPGRPLAFGRIGEALYFGLPGNPVAVMITFLFFAREALLGLAGARTEPLPKIRARASAPIRKRPGRTEYQRGLLAYDDGMPKVSLTGSQGSGVLRSMSEAQCIVVLPHDQADVAAGDLVDCIPSAALY